MEKIVNQAPILLMVEDDPGIREQLSWCFDNYQVETAANREQAIAKLRRFEPPVVTLDLGLPPDEDGCTEGLATLTEILKLAPMTKVIMVTGKNTREMALKAISMGAYDFYPKPIEPKELTLIVDRAYYLHQLEKENQKWVEYTTTNAIKGMVSESPSMLATSKMIEKVAPTNARVLLLGESGTGKEVLARGLHQLSDRHQHPFVALNCAAIPETLLESELFGYEKGAFTGATKSTPGKIERAQQGTLFLDEIGDLPCALQPKLLRFLQENTIERLGGHKEIALDVRVVCATHQSLEALIEAKSFREDLFYRISEISIDIPPLRERQNDALLLARVFLSRFSKMMGKKIKGFDSNALTALSQYHWPGNVRELENKVKRAVILAEASQITVEDLALPNQDEVSMPFNLKQIRDDAEKEALCRAISFSNGNLSKTAALLGITRPTLYNLLEKLGLKERIEEPVE